jgi:hypothetical protein
MEEASLREKQRLEELQIKLAEQAELDKERYQLMLKIVDDNNVLLQNQSLM